VLRNNYYYNARVIDGSAGGLRTGHVQICGWSTDGSSTDLRVVYGSMGGYRVVYGLSLGRGHGVPIGQIIIQITVAPGGVSCATITIIIIMIR